MLVEEGRSGYREIFKQEMIVAKIGILTLGIERSRNIEDVYRKKRG